MYRALVNAHQSWRMKRREKGRLTDPSHLISKKLLEPLTGPAHTPLRISVGAGSILDGGYNHSQSVNSAPPSTRSGWEHKVWTPPGVGGKVVKLNPSCGG